MIRLRQVVFAHPDLGVARAELEAALGPLVGDDGPFPDPGVAEFGLHNAVYPAGEDFIEIVSPLPDRAGTTAVDRFLARRGGPGGYMVIFQTDEPLDAVRARLGTIRIVFEAVTDGIVGLHLHPADTGGAIVSIDRTDEWDEWPWAGPAWRRRRAHPQGIGGVRSVTFATDDSASFAQRWAAMLGVSVERQGDGWELPLADGGAVRVTSNTDSASPDVGSRAAGVIEYTFVQGDNEPVDTELLGVRCRTEP